MGTLYQRRIEISLVGSAAREPFALAALDRVLGLTAFVAALPVIAASGLVVWALSRRSPFIAIERVGRGGRSLWMLKLRTMWTGRPAGVSNGRMERIIDRIHEEGVPAEKREMDPRVTSRFARFCRRLSIDELPQLWHVARGEMSLVGPRPLTKAELVTHYGGEAVLVLSLRPGLTGLWQIQGRNALSYGERRKLDLQLVREYSWKLYWSILMRTIPGVISAKNAW